MAHGESSFSVVKLAISEAEVTIVARLSKDSLTTISRIHLARTYIEAVT